MKILGSRILVSKVDEEVKGDFQAVEVQDNFLFKGKIEQVGPIGIGLHMDGLVEGATVLFSKYSPDTQDVEHEGKKMKIINVNDVLAIL